MRIKNQLLHLQMLVTLGKAMQDQAHFITMMNKETPDFSVYPVVLDNRQPGLVIEIETGRCVWVTWHEDTPGYLVWFSALSNEDEAERSSSMFIDDTNPTPNPKYCKSALVFNIDNTVAVIVHYLSSGKLPENTMPPGHLRSNVDF